MPPQQNQRTEHKTMVVAEEILGNDPKDEQQKRSRVFTYGTLKNGFSNHTLMQDLIRTGDAVFMGIYRTAERYPLVCGPYRVPFLLNIPGSGYHVTGEVYAVTGKGLIRLDELEGTTKGHYERLPIKLVPEKMKAEMERVEEDAETDGYPGRESIKVNLAAEAYFGHRSYALEMWKKEEAKRGFYHEYTEKVAIGYVKRKDRPQHLTFLDHIRSFLSSD